MTPVVGKLVLHFVLAGSAALTYFIARRLGLSVDQALTVALISTVCMVGSWHT